MSSLSKFLHKSWKLACMIEDPILYKLYRQGISIDTFNQLNQKWIKELQIGTILDIGANIGNFALLANTVIPNAKIYSFEPLTECFNVMQKRFRGKKNLIPINKGLGAKKEQLVFERNEFPESSSFLKLSSLHKSHFPYAVNVTQQTVQVEILDDLIQEIDIVEPLMIKIDVQGYEDKVIIGGRKTFQKAQILLIETSFEELYEGQPLFHDIYTKLSDLGFIYAGSIDGNRSEVDGRIVQENSIFIRNE